jgi:hypothetical protein
MPKKNLYLCVTNDEYELPIAVEDSPTELAFKLGVNRHTILNGISRYNRGEIKGIYRRVEVELEDE